MNALWELLPPMTLFAFVTTISPGPNNFLLASSGAHFGIRQSWRHLLGIRIGVIGLLLLCAGGVGLLLQQSPGLYLMLKYIGLSYMLWLVLKLLTSNPFTTRTQRGRPMSVLEATLFQLGNIKAWMASLAMISSYSLASHYWLSILLITVVFTISGLCANTFWTWLGQKISTYLNTVTRQKTFNIALATLIFLSVLPTITVDM